MRFDLGSGVARRGDLAVGRDWLLVAWLLVVAGVGTVPRGGRAHRRCNTEREGDMGACRRTKWLAGQRQAMDRNLRLERLLDPLGRPPNRGVGLSTGSAPRMSCKQRVPIRHGLDSSERGGRRRRVPPARLAVGLTVWPPKPRHLQAIFRNGFYTCPASGTWRSSRRR